MDSRATRIDHVCGMEPGAQNLRVRVWQGGEPHSRALTGGAPGSCAFSPRVLAPPLKV